MKLIFLSELDLMILRLLIVPLSLMKSILHLMVYFFLKSSFISNYCWQFAISHYHSSSSCCKFFSLPFTLIHWAVVLHILGYEQLFGVNFFHSHFLWSCLHTVMLIMVVTRDIASLSLDSAYSCFSMAWTTNEIIWLRWLLVDLRVFLFHQTPLYCDNKSSI